MARSPKGRMVTHQALPKNAGSDADRKVNVSRSPQLEIAPVDMAIVGFMGRDMTITGLASYPAIKSMTVDTSGTSIGPNSLDYEHSYRETCSLRLAPGAAGQLAFSIVNAIRDADPKAFEDFKQNIQEILKSQTEGAH